MSGKKIVVLGTGGTIAGTAASAGDNIGYTAAQVGVEQLIAAVPPLAGWPLASEQVAQVDSKDMDAAIWRQLAQRCAHWLAQDDVQGIVITHGTDTLEETAYFLHAVLAPAKPVVLTCAMRPATALVPDGPQNLLDAVTLARDAAWCGVQAVLGGRPPTLEDLDRLPYAGWVISESMRLYPPAWILDRQAIADDMIGGLPVRRGTIVGISPYTLHRHPAFWDNPEGFDPDRFLPERSVGRPKFAWFPFSGGQRKCIGDQFTWLELTTVLATVLRAYRFELREGHEVVPSPNVTLPMRDPLPMRLIPR